MLNLCSTKDIQQQMFSIQYKNKAYIASEILRTNRLSVTEEILSFWKASAVFASHLRVHITMTPMLVVNYGSVTIVGYE